MTSSADLGGRPGFGAIPAIDDKDPFHSDWERKVLAMTLAMGASGRWNIDMSRHARESLPQDQYLSSGYYEIWHTALENLLVEKQLVSPEELTSGAASAKALEKPFLEPENVAKVLSRGTPYLREAASKAKFDEGDIVCTVPTKHEGHTRLPGYLAGKSGTIETVYGAHVFPDASSAGHGEEPQWLYRVVFADVFEPGVSISADLWEPYLEGA